MKLVQLATHAQRCASRPSTLPRVQFLCAGLLFLTLALPVQAQPNPNCWVPPSTVNPSGSQVVPYVNYDANTGMLSVDTRGLNGVIETPQYTVVGGLIGGDDVGMISILVETPITGGTILPPFTGLDLNQLITWSSQYFNGKYQIIGNPAAGLNGNQFLWPGVYNLVQLPTGLTTSDFESVEMGLNFAPVSMLPPGFPTGATLFSDDSDPSCPAGGVVVVPEPAAYTFVVFGALVLSASSLRRRTTGPMERK